MPVMTDTVNNPEITVDASGKETMPTEIQKVGPDGRYLSEEDLKVANEPVKSETEVKEEAKVKEEAAGSEAQARKMFLAAQKAERKAKEMEKKAAEGLKKSEAIEAAIELTKSGKDPTALLKAAGVDPIQFYKDMTTFALKSEEKPEGPQEKINREHKERLDKYAKDLEVQAKSIQEKEELAQHNQIITAQVVPLLQSNPDKYESLLKEYGPNAAVEVYKQVWELYQQKGETMSFEQAADQLEEYWTDKIKSGINEASKMKKFMALFAQQ